MISGDLLLLLPPSDLFDPLEKARTALNTAPRFDVPKLPTDSSAIATECGRAIAKAKAESSPSAAQCIRMRRDSERRAGAG